MSRVYKLEGSTLTNRVLLNYAGEGDAEYAAAADGTGSYGRVTFEDPDNSLTVRGFMPFTVTETDCTDAPRLTTSWIWKRVYRKSPDGRGRQIVCELLDPNGLLSLRLLTGGDTVRPAEDDTARLAWLIGSDYLDGLVQDLGLVNGSGRDFDAEDLHGKLPAEVLADLAGKDGQTFFAYWDQTAEAVGLFFDLPEAVSFTSTISISNVDGDQSTTCFAPFMDAEGTVSPEDVISNIRYVYKGGVIYENNLTTAATFFPSPLLRRGINVENLGVGKVTTARAFAQRILARRAFEIVTLGLTIQMPSTHVGLIDAGMRVFVRLSHVPGYESGAYARVERRTYTSVEGSPTEYLVHLELSTYGYKGPSGGGGNPGDFPHQTNQPGTLVQSAIFGGSTILTGTPVDGDLMFLWITERATATYPVAPAGWTSVATAKDTSVYADNYYARLCMKTASGESTLLSLGSANYQATFMEFSGVSFGAEVHQSDQNVGNAALPVDCGGAITPSAANAIVVGCAIFGTFGGSDITWDSGVTAMTTPTDLDFSGNAPSNSVGYKVLTTAVSTTIQGTATGRHEHGGVTFTLIPDAATAQPPAPGQPVPWEVVTMTDGATGSTGTTAFPYAPGSLLVKVDGVIISPASYVEVNPSCGDFALTWNKDTDEVVSVQYVGA